MNGVNSTSLKTGWIFFQVVWKGPWCLLSSFLAGWSVHGYVSPFPPDLVPSFILSWVSFHSVVVLLHCFLWVLQGRPCLFLNLLDVFYEFYCQLALSFPLGVSPFVGVSSIIYVCFHTIMCLWPTECIICNSTYLHNFLRSHILETMVSEFKEHLRMEIANLKALVRSFLPGHYHGYSCKSIFCYSIKSDKSANTHPEVSESSWDHKTWFCSIVIKGCLSVPLIEFVQVEYFTNLCLVTQLKQNGENPMDDWTLSLYENLVHANHSAQSNCWWLMNEHKYRLISWFICSVCPSICGDKPLIDLLLLRWVCGDLSWTELQIEGLNCWPPFREVCAYSRCGPYRSGPCLLCLVPCLLAAQWSSAKGGPLWPRWHCSHLTLWVLWSDWWECILMAW